MGKDVVYTYTVEYHSATEKNVALIDAVTQMNLGDMMLNRPVTRDKHYDHTYWNIEDKQIQVTEVY